MAHRIHPRQLSAPTIGAPPNPARDASTLAVPTRLFLTHANPSRLVDNRENKGADCKQMQVLEPVSIKRH